MRPVCPRAAENGHRAAGAHAHPELRAPANQHVADAAHRMRSVGVAVRIAPREIRSRHRHFSFHEFVIRLEVPVGERPIHADAILGMNLEIRRMKARCEGSPVHRASADALAAIVCSQSQRILPPVMRLSFQYSLCDPVSSLTQSRSVSQNGPASNPMTRNPARARRCSRTPPPAPTPTMT